MHAITYTLLPSFGLLYFAHLSHRLTMTGVNCFFAFHVHVMATLGSIMALGCPVLAPVRAATVLPLRLIIAPMAAVTEQFWTSVGYDVCLTYALTD